MDRVLKKHLLISTGTCGQAKRKKKEMYAKQYNVFMEAMIREHCRDVTAQVISAFRTAIKPGLKDRLPDKDALFGAGIQLFVEAMKAWTNHH